MRRIAIRVHEGAETTARVRGEPATDAKARADRGRPAFEVVDFDTGEALPVARMSLRPGAGGVVAELRLVGATDVADVEGVFVGFVLPSGPPPPCAECGGTGLVDRGDRMTLCGCKRKRS